MKIIKPLRLSVLYRPYRWMQKNHLGISIMALADMGATPHLRPEPELWQLADKELKTCNGIVDLAIPKSCAEFLATGYAYTHHQTDKTACAARIQIGQREKTLAVFGDRYWVDGIPSKPQPFEQMRLDWSRAFGGAGYDDNPLGIGFKPETRENGIRIHRLPNIETQHEPLLSSDATPNPVSFCPLDFSWPGRFSRMGKQYDEAWLENEFPGFAHDIDWRAFNTAPPDQWWEQLNALPVQAAWRIENMHPEKPIQEGKLPAWRARCFIKRLRLDDEIIEEIHMRQTTVWFFPHLEQMILIWHGCSLINEDDAADVLQMVTALELSDAPRPEDHYLPFIRQRTDDEKNVRADFQEKDLIPEEIIGPWVDTELPVSSSIQENLQNHGKRLREQQKERLAADGKDINTALPGASATQESPPSPEAEVLPPFIEKTPVEDQSRGPENVYRFREILNKQQQSMTSSDPKLAQSEQLLRSLYFASVQSQKPALRLTGNQAHIARNQVQNLMAQGGDFSGMDFTGADLSGMDLRGANFSQALLESCCFNNSRLDDADFSQAMLARAEICNASLSGAKLDKASLILAQCEHSDFSATRFKETQLQEALFDHCQFSDASFTDLFLQKVYIAHCDFQSSHWKDCILTELALPALNFNYADLNNVSFFSCKLQQATFDHARLESCAWVETQANQIRFCSATLLTSAFTLNSELNQADFSQAVLTECNLRQMPLVQARFHTATLHNCDLSEADCQSADMQYLDGAKSLFIRTDFRGAWLNNANLMSALMQKCNFSGTDLRQANLFRADMSQSIVDESTLFEGAYTRSTKTLPKQNKELI
ncbi:MAG: DUF2169 domain-containing protein [Enterobacteriaceae bacterium]|jgi:uncharacterized protein YjbI with pentapeptide repeats|nr:DUF2169 domain-containing protein [Enterobacteriaceae bacterium]